MFDVDIWGNVADWVVAVTALVGVGFAIFQLRALRKTEQLSVQLARATLLRDFDRDYEGKDMLDSRLKLVVVRNRIETEVSQRKPKMSDAKQIEEVARLFSDHVTDIWEKSRTFDGNPNVDKDKSGDEYALLMRLPHWCETVGHLCRRNLIPLEDILDLYDQMVIMVIGNIILHIQMRADRPPHKNRRFLENAVWLYGEAINHKHKRDTPTQIAPRKAATEWGN
jgi:hypothetical protein